MAFQLSAVKGVATVTIVLVFIGALAFLIGPMLWGVGDAIADGMGTDVNGSTLYTNANSATANTSSVFSDVFSFLPWLAVGIAVISLFGLTRIMRV